MIIRRRLQQMEEAKMADRDDAGERSAANDDDIDDVHAVAPDSDSLNTGKASPSN